MTNYDDFAARYELHRKARKRADKHNKTVVLPRHCCRHRPTTCEDRSYAAHHPACKCRDCI